MGLSLVNQTDGAEKHRESVLPSENHIIPLETQPPTQDIEDGRRIQSTNEENIVLRE